MFSTPRSSPRKENQMSQGYPRDVSATRRSVSGEDSPSPSKRARMADIASVCRIRQRMIDLAGLIPHVRDGQETVLDSIENATKWTEEIVKGNEALKARLKCLEKNQEIEAAHRQQEAFIQYLPASPERPSPQPTAKYCPNGQQESRPQNLPERLRFAGETSKHPCSPDLPGLGVRTSLKVNGRLGSPHVRRTFTPMGFGSDDGSSPTTADPLLGKSMQFAGTAPLSSPAEHSSSAEAKAAITGPAWLDYLNLDYLNNVKLSCEIREKLMKNPTFHAAIGLLSHHTNQLLAHVNGFEISNAHLHAAAAGDFTDYVEHLETYAIQESIIRHCFRPIVQVSISNWQLLIDHVQGAIQLDWVSGIGKERNGKRFFAMLTGPDYEYSEGWQQYDVVAVKQSLNEEEWDQVLEWLDAKSDIFLACTRRLENLKVPKRATVLEAEGKYLILEASKPTESTTEEVGLRSKLPIGAMPKDEQSRKYIMSDSVIAFADVHDEASDAELDKEDELASVDHISWINNN